MNRSFAPMCIQHHESDPGNMVSRFTNHISQFGPTNDNDSPTPTIPPPTRKRKRHSTPTTSHQPPGEKHDPRKRIQSFQDVELRNLSPQQGPYINFPLDNVEQRVAYICRMLPPEDLTTILAALDHLLERFSSNGQVSGGARAVVTQPDDTSSPTAHISTRTRHNIATVRRVKDNSTNLERQQTQGSGSIPRAKHTEKRLLACPIQQHANHYKLQSTCNFKGAKNISELKSHLRRKYHSAVMEFCEYCKSPYLGEPCHPTGFPDNTISWQPRGPKQEKTWREIYELIYPGYKNTLDIYAPKDTIVGRTISTAYNSPTATIDSDKEPSSYTTSYPKNRDFTCPTPCVQDPWPRNIIEQSRLGMLSDDFHGTAIDIILGVLKGAFQDIPGTIKNLNHLLSEPNSLNTNKFRDAVIRIRTLMHQHAGHNSWLYSPLPPDQGIVTMYGQNGGYTHNF